MPDGYIIPIWAWVVVIGSESIDLLAEAFMKKSARFTNHRATCIAYFLDIITTTSWIWCLRDIDFLTVNFVTDIVGDLGCVIISVFFFKESMTISKLIAIFLIIAGSLFLALAEEDEDDRWAPWPASWDEPLWGTGKSYVVPSAIDVSDTSSDIGDNLDHDGINNITGSNGNTHMSSIMMDHNDNEL